MRAYVNAFVDELEKIATTRAVKEWRAAMARGDEVTADQIAHGYGQLDVNPRYLKRLGQGQEGLVDLRMGPYGAPAGPVRPAPVNPTGYFAAKMHDPFSPIAQNEFVGPHIRLREEITNAARGLSPDADAMVTKTYGHKEVAPGRWVSGHEYVRDASRFHGGPEEVLAEHKAKQLVDRLRQQGYDMGDVIKEGPNGVITHGGGNLVETPSGSKILDFSGGIVGELSPSQRSYIKYGPTQSPFDPELGDRSTALRKEVYRPSLPPTAAQPEGLQVMAREVVEGKRAPLTERDVARFYAGKTGPETMPPAARPAPSSMTRPTTRPAMRTMPPTIAPSRGSVSLDRPTMPPSMAPGRVSIVPSMAPSKFEMPSLLEPSGHALSTPKVPSFIGAMGPESGVTIRPTPVPSSGVRRVIPSSFPPAAAVPHFGEAAEHTALDTAKRVLRKVRIGR